MTSHTTATIQDFLASTSPFSQLAPAVLARLLAKSQMLRYRMGQSILVRENMPTQISIIYEGQARLLGYDPRTGIPTTLQILKPGEILGWVGVLRGVPCETVIASTETICLTLPVADFVALLAQEPTLAAAFRERCALIEVFDLSTLR